MYTPPPPPHPHSFLFISNEPIFSSMVSFFGFSHFRWDFLGFLIFVGIFLGFLIFVGIFYYVVLRSNFMLTKLGQIPAY